MMDPVTRRLVTTRPSAGFRSPLYLLTMLQYIASSLIIAAAWSLDSLEDFDPIISELMRSMEMDAPKRMDTLTSTTTATTVATLTSSRTTRNATEGTNTTEPFQKIVLPGTVRNGSITTARPYACPEERPLNIGAYEVPSQRDLVLHARAVLLSMFRSYHRRTLGVLRDMKEATKAAWPREKVCPAWAKETYRRCVRQVRDRCVGTAKGLVSSLEALRLDVSDLIEGKICNMSSINTDPIQLIRILAAEKVSLEFALPGFLRLLNACSVYCSSSQHHFKTIVRKPLRKLTDQDLVIRHFLTRKDLAQLLKKTT